MEIFKLIIKNILISLLFFTFILYCGHYIQDKLRGKKPKLIITGYVPETYINGDNVRSNTVYLNSLLAYKTLKFKKDTTFTFYGSFIEERVVEIKVIKNGE